MDIEEIKSFTAMLGITYGTALVVANKEPSPGTAPVVNEEPVKRKVFIFNSSVVEQIFSGATSCYCKNPKLVAIFIMFVQRLIATGEQFQCRGGLWMLLHVLYGCKGEFSTEEFCALKRVIDFAPDYTDAGECHNCLSTQFFKGKHHQLRCAMLCTIEIQ